MCTLRCSAIILFTLNTSTHEHNDSSFQREQIVMELKTLQSLAAQPELASIKIPEPLIHLVDKGENPDVYIQSVLESLVLANQKSLGRTSALKMLQSELERGMQIEYPLTKQEPTAGV